MSFLLVSVLTSLRPYKLTSQQKVLRSLPRTAPRIFYAWQMTLVTVLSIGRLESSSLAPAPHRRSCVNRSLSCVFTGHLCAEVRLLFRLVPWPSPSPGTACAPLHANLRALRRIAPVAGVDSPSSSEIRSVTYIPSGYTNLILIQRSPYAPAPSLSSERRRPLDYRRRRIVSLDGLYGQHLSHIVGISGCTSRANERTIRPSITDVADDVTSVNSNTGTTEVTSHPPNHPSGSAYNLRFLLSPWALEASYFHHFDVRK